MPTAIPKTSAALSSLLKADFTTQWRNRRAVALTIVLPIVILVTWKGLIAKFGGAFVLSNSITTGLVASGLMGYSNAIARDRDKGIFQRLRVAPVPSWTIMGSRLLVQLTIILLITTLVFVVAYQNLHIVLTPLAYVVTYFTAIAGGLLYLSIGQTIVGFIKNPETVNSTSRLIYFLFIMIGMLGEIYLKDMKDYQYLVSYSPYGTVKTLLSVSMEPANWNNDASLALLATVAYIIIFTVLGVKWFKWNTK